MGAKAAGQPGTQVQGQTCGSGIFPPEQTLDCDIVRQTRLQKGKIPKTIFNKDNSCAESLKAKVNLGFGLFQSSPHRYDWLLMHHIFKR